VAILAIASAKPLSLEMISATRHPGRVKNPGLARGLRPEILGRPDPAVLFRMTLVNALIETAC
jgi:hypothetical protein